MSGAMLRATARMNSGIARIRMDAAAAMAIIDKGKQPVYDDQSSEMHWTNDMFSEESLKFLDVTEGLQRLYLGSEDSTPRRLSLTDPRSFVSSPEDQTTRQSPPVPPRPGSKKARTAPPGPLKLVSLPPEPPRRAISARRSPRRAKKENADSRDVSPSSPITRIPVSPQLASRTRISRRKSGRVSGGRIGLKPKVPVWRVAAIPNTRHFRDISGSSNETGAGWWDPQTRRSFSSRQRVQEALKGRRMEMLRTGLVDFTERALPETPGSVVTTPRELYQGWTPDKPSPPPAQKRAALQAITPNKGQAKSSPSTSSPRVHCPGGLRRGSPAWKLRTGSTLTIVSPEEAAWQQHVYIPGPIRLETTVSAIARKESIATLDPFLSTVVKAEPRRASDDAVIDAIVGFFEDFHILSPSDDAGLDRYWDKLVDPPKRALPRRPPPPPALMPSALSVLVPSPHSSPRTPRQLSSGSTPKSAGRTPQQRIKLRRLLGSATSIL
ncbi:uncharacterized protein BDZ99DRAFT_478126 [Mytilinidion resinicola]|uniref:Uncharacterized protein n=1 Tax=Mytilinidion resinicola TaxID=574789 RepID=A0A6A6YJG4_9PEZI|nr:uncharacterized protein BDZ99DRAFT_478126 [Mytilinidion resinicola]KAF2808663.1 hypothetical protein BDZ99DRAFT_478126 [Mytilinidion resinicola]